MRNCGSCALRSLTRDHSCPVFQETFRDDEPGCPRYKSDLINCDMCGNPIIGTETIFLNTQDQSQKRIYCEQCSSLVGKCPTCRFQRVCDFETNPSPLPKTIQQQIRQGNAVMMTEIRNPERVAATCEKNCSCFDKEFGCMKQNDFCMKWRIRQS